MVIEMPRASELAKCVKQRKAFCSTFRELMGDSHVVSSILEDVELEGEDSTYVGGMYSNLLALHEICKGNYGSQEVNELMDDNAEELADDTEWIRAASEKYKEWEDGMAKKIEAGDKEALKDLLEASYERMTGESPSDMEVVREAIKKLDEDEDDEDGDEFDEHIHRPSE
jgi:hypothetical protein